MQPDGTYVKPDKRGKTLICAQDYFCQEAIERAKKPAAPLDGRVFIPAEPVEWRKTKKARAAHNRKRYKEKGNLRRMTPAIPFFVSNM